MNRYDLVSELRLLSPSCIFHGVCPKKFCDKGIPNMEEICLNMGEGIYFELHSRIQELQGYTQEDIQELEDYIEEINS